MTRQINLLAYETYDDLISQLPRSVKKEEIDQLHRVVTIELSEAVVLTVYEDEILLDLGGTLFTIDQNEFDSITIR